MIGKDIRIIEDCECDICELLREAERIKKILTTNKGSNE